MTVSVEKRFGSIDLEAVESCSVCGCNQFSPAYAGLVDLEEGVAGTWSMVKCEGCNSLLLNPRPTLAALPKVYGSYYTHAPPVAENAVLEGEGEWGIRNIANAYLSRRYGVGKPGPAWMAMLAKVAWPLRQQLDYHLRHLPKAAGQLLDLGCGSGGFLQRAHSAGWNSVGVEPDPAAARIASEASGTHIYNSIDDVPPGYYDVITMSHVIEHLYDPRRMLAACYARLRPGGHLWIATPNISGMGRRIYGDAWQALETPRHLVMPAPKALVMMLGDVGFSDVRFLKRGRGASKRLRASAQRARVLGRRAWPATVLAAMVDVAAGTSALAAEELVIIATKNAR